jgi:hypothetical protein
MTDQFPGPTKMDLSPAAQAVLDAVRKICPAPADEIAAAALRAVADQHWEVPPWYRGDDYLIFRDAVTTERNRLLAFATELDPTP